MDIFEELLKQNQNEMENDIRELCKQAKLMNQSKEFVIGFILEMIGLDDSILETTEEDKKEMVAILDKYY